MGVEYEYTDVDSIKTGFGDKNLSFAEYKRKGSFYYQIEINGQTITFHAPSPNGDIERYEEHTYLELEEFDQSLVKLGIPKEADKKGWENCDFDKEYVDRFLRIIKMDWVRLRDEEGNAEQYRFIIKAISLGRIASKPKHGRFFLPQTPQIGV